MKRIVCALLMAILLVTALTPASAQSAGQQFSQFFENDKKENPASPDPYMLGAEPDPAVVDKGDALIEEGEYAQALAVYEAALSERSGVAEYHNGRGIALLLGTNRISEALDAFNEAIQRDSGDWTFYCNRGLAYRIYGDEEAGIENYAEAKRLAGATAAQGTAPTADGGTRLMNYEDWLRPYVDVMPIQPTMLDIYPESKNLGNGLVQEVVTYPRAWPSLWLDDAIPEYTGVGWMYDLFVVHPNMSYAAKDLRHVAVTVYDYDPADVDAYIADLLANGFQEKADSPYNADGWADSVRCFTNAVCMLNVVYAKGEGGMVRIGVGDDPGEGPLPFVQFNVDFYGDAYTPDLSATPDTELLNYFQYYEILEGVPADQLKYSMDKVTDETVDEYGRLYETTYFPSKWPKDVFGNLVPEYRSQGLMYYMLVTTPADNPSRDKTLIASIYILDYRWADVERYVQELLDFGYRQVPKKEYTEQEALVAADSLAYFIFTLPSMRCTVCVFYDEEMDTNTLSMTLRFDGRYNNFFNQ